MSNPTSNFGWQMPEATDLVTDLPADFEVFGQAVDTDFVDLLGGTTGQVLSKTSATDLDFTWIANDQGDITGVTAGNGITVTDPTGPVPTVAINTAVTADLTTAQTLTNKKLSDSTTTIVDVSDATKAIKFDVAGTTAVTGTIATAFTTAKTVTIPDTTGTVALTNGVINNTLTSTTGDIVYASAANTPARLGIGSSAQVLSVSSGIPAWTTASSGAVTQIAQTVLTSTAATITFSSISGYSNLRVVWSGKGPGASTAGLQLRFNGDTGANYYRQRFQATAATGSFGEGLGITSLMVGEIYALVGGGSITIPNYARTVLNKVAVGSHFAIYGTSSGQLVAGMQTGSWANTGAITQLDFTTDSGSFQIGTVFTLYGES